MQLKSIPEDFIVREHASLTLGGGAHKVFLLRKRDRNTEDCLQEISRMLNIPRKDIGYCGNKDKRAVTEQYITIKNAPAQIRTPSTFTLTYVGSQQEALRLGGHERNFFIITVRDLTTTEQPVLSTVKNYFGEQRFSDANDTVGFALLRRDYRGAADALGLTYTTDPISALRTVPKHTLLLYVHAAQSRLWNTLVKTLPAQQGMVPLAGYASTGDPEYLNALQQLLAEQQLTREAFVNKSIPELSLEGGARALLQDVQDFSASTIRDGVCTMCFSLGKGSYATETVKALFEKGA
jgi:tRNA(Glu) U13 pseudouridine synthase TruD